MTLMALLKEIFMGTNIVIRIIVGSIFLFNLQLVSALLEPVDEIAAVVEDDVIMRTDLEKSLKQIIKVLKEAKQPLPPKDELVTQALERLINNKLQLLAAARLGIQVSGDEVASALSDIARKNKLNIGGMKRKLAKEGITLADFRKNLKEELIKQKFLGRAVYSRIRVSKSEINNYLAGYKETVSAHLKYDLQHMLIKTSIDSSEEELQAAAKKAQDIVKQLRAGANFTALSIQYSDAKNADKGGYLGLKPLSEIPTIFSKTVALMKENEISDPIKGSSGYYILKLNKIVGKKADKKQLLKQYRVRQILIKNNAVTSDKAAKLRLLQLKKRIEGGDDFVILARANSDNKEAAIKGGDLGWVSIENVPNNFADTLKNISLNQVSEPFSTDKGWQIIQVTKRRTFDNSENYLKTQVQRRIRAKKFEEEKQNFIRQLRDEAYIETRL